MIGTYFTLSGDPAAGSGVLVAHSRCHAGVGKKRLLCKSKFEMYFKVRCTPVDPFISRFAVRIRSTLYLIVVVLSVK